MLVNERNVRYARKTSVSSRYWRREKSLTPKCPRDETHVKASHVKKFAHKRWNMSEQKLRLRRIRRQHVGRYPLSGFIFFKLGAIGKKRHKEYSRPWRVVELLWTSLFFFIGVSFSLFSHFLSPESTAVSALSMGSKFRHECKEASHLMEIGSMAGEWQQNESNSKSKNVIPLQVAASADTNNGHRDGGHH